MKTYKIAIIPGDGIGPEVIAEGWKVLTAAARKHDFRLESQAFDFGARRYLKTGETLSDKDIEALKAFDAIYLGAIGHPDVKPGILEKGILLKLRFDFDQYINLRPVRLYENVETPIKKKKPEDIDYTVVRENTGGLYTGQGGIESKGSPEEVATQKMVYSRKQVERCVRYAFEYIKTHHSDKPWRGLTADERKQGFIGKLTLCGKSNVLTYVFDLWQRVFDEVAKEYPNIKTDYVHVDAICIYMIESPERFNVIVTTNMFGDIITDLAAVTQGGMGVAPSGNINPTGLSMFEPVHGSAPQFTGKGVANPIAAIAAAKMMLDSLGENAAARDIETAMRKAIKKMRSMLVGKMGFSTSQIGDMVAKSL
jgi:3-isopropylmalate dehydrogenase